MRAVHIIWRQSCRLCCDILKFVQTRDNPISYDFENTIFYPAAVSNVQLHRSEGVLVSDLHGRVGAVVEDVAEGAIDNKTGLETLGLDLDPFRLAPGPPGQLNHRCPQLI